MLLLVRVAAIQMQIGGSLETNLDRAEKHITAAATQGADFVCLPEYFSYSPSLNSLEDLVEAYNKSKAMLQKQSARNNICLIGCL